MIYIYNDFAGTHTTSIAAAYHLNKLPPNLPLSKEDILQIPYFNELTTKDAGKLIFHGTDEDDNPVYTIGRRSSKIVVPALKEMCLLLFELCDFEEKIIFSNTSPTVPFMMSIGGLLSRGLGIDSLGVPLLVKGTQKCHSLIQELVEETKRIGAEEQSEKVVVLENKDFHI
ncbi:DUF3189 family protein [Halobacillus salinus]|uniref:DUF3189 family protein n=1 Tax=Halobacillus salinus TaxID=192814 RepID=UPI0009A673D1|nr:DUF3189 family protein [Halobacillus salinus]